MADFSWINESELSWEERLGLAYCRLNTHQWDELLGEKPEQYDDSDEAVRLSVKIMEHIRQIIGPAKANECWWRFTQIGSREEWLRWYCVDHVLACMADPVKKPFNCIPKWLRKKGSAKG